MGPKKGRKNVMRIVPTYTPTQPELGDTATDIQRRREVRKQGEEGGRQITEEGKGEGGSQEDGNHTVHRRGSG